MLPKEKQKDALVLASFIVREGQLAKESYQVHLAFAKKYINSYIGLISLAHVAAQPEMAKEAGKLYAAVPENLKNNLVGKNIPPFLAATNNTQIGAMSLDFEQNTPEGKLVKLSSFIGASTF